MFSQRARSDQAVGSFSAVLSNEHSHTRISQIEKNGNPCMSSLQSTECSHAILTVLLHSPGYIAGVTNPIFESSGSWDLLCDIGTSRMVISKDIHTNFPASGGVPPVQLITRTGTLKAEGSAGSEEEMAVRPSKELSSVQKAEFIGKFDNADNIFMDDVSDISVRCQLNSWPPCISQIISAISLHYGEAHVRARFAEYAARFVRLAARYEEDVLGITTSIGYPTATYTEHYGGEESQLGSGICFSDDAARARELAVNTSRIEAWRRTESYQLFQIVSQLYIVFGLY